MTEIPEYLLRRAIEDLKRLHDGYEPPASVLADAPILDGWAWSEHGGLPALAGFVTGHPIIEEGHACVTSPVIAIDDDGAWVRTVSRFYRLGRPLGKTHDA